MTLRIRPLPFLCWDRRMGFRPADRRMGARSVWTGSCPCQPLSSAGQRKGHADERHLWPAFHRLIAERKPATVFGNRLRARMAGNGSPLYVLTCSPGICLRGRRYAGCGRRGAAHPTALVVGGRRPKPATGYFIRRRTSGRPMEKSTHLQTIIQLAGCRRQWLARHAGAARLQRSGQHGHRAEDGGIALGVADAECSERDSCNIYSRNSAEG